MFKRNDCCVCNRCERRENCFLLSCIIFLSRKIHLKLLQGFLYLEKYCSNFKKNLGKILHLKILLELIFEVCSSKNKFS